MNSPFGRLSLWIIIAIAVLLLGGCMQPLRGRAGLDVPYEPPHDATFSLLPVPRKGIIPAAYVPDGPQETAPPIDVPPPEANPPINNMRPSGRVALGPLRWRPPSHNHNHQRPMAHHPAYPHRR